MKNVFSRFKHAWRVLAGLALFVAAVPMAFAGTGNPAKFIVVDNSDSAFSVSGAWGTLDTDEQIGPSYGFNARTHAGVGAGTDVARWDIGSYPSATGDYAFDVFVPATSASINSAAVYHVEQSALCIGAFTTIHTFSAFNQNLTVNEGQFKRLGTVPLTAGSCYRLVLSAVSADTDIMYADAIRVERLFESKATIPDMPFVATNGAVGILAIPSSSNAVPTIVTSLSVTCPASGKVAVTGSGSSTAKSTNAAAAFIGLGYSISTSTATDNTNLVESSAVAWFVGDTNRDFLNVARVDDCTSGATTTYRLTAYRTTPDTDATSFIYNGRLVANFFP